MGDDGEEQVTDGFFSDDSSFYGDDHLRAELEERAVTFDPRHYWSTHNSELSVIAYNARAQASASAPAAKELHNVYEDNPSGRRLSEDIATFLTRLPPLTTRIADSGPWIYIANPHQSPRPTSADEAGFMRRGHEILEEFEATRAGIEASMAGKAKSAIGRQLTPLRKRTEAALYAAAQEKGCTSGKWMLFPAADDVNRVWSLVATATAAGELGHAAKVATDDGAGTGTPRLICVYTEDFADEGDVGRVLAGLDGMGLVKRKGPVGEERGIYYKADAFTFLGIDSQNPWGLKASLFSSRDLLAGAKGEA